MNWLSQGVTFWSGRKEEVIGIRRYNDLFFGKGCREQTETDTPFDKMAVPNCL